MISSQDRNTIKHQKLAHKKGLLTWVFVPAFFFAQASFGGFSIAQEQDESTERRSSSREDQDRASLRPKDKADLKPRQLRPGPYIPPELLDAFADEVRKQKEKAEAAVAEAAQGIERSANQQDDNSEDEQGSSVEIENGDLGEPATPLLLMPGDIGIVSNSGFSLSPNLWVGTSNSMQKQLMENLGPSNGSNFLAKIKNSILTQKFALNATSHIDVSLLAVRLKALQTIGDYASLTSLLAQMPDTMDTEQTRQIRLDLMLLDGDVVKACTYSTNLMDMGLVTKNISSHQRLRSFCLALNADVDSLDALMDRLMGTGGVDQEYSNLVYGILKLATDNTTLDENAQTDGAGSTSTAGSRNGAAIRQSLEVSEYTGQLNPLIFAMMNIAQITPSFEQAQQAPLIVKERILAISSTLPDTDRALLAKDLVNKGVLDVQVLRNIYLSIGDGQSVNQLLNSLNETIDIRVDAGLYRHFEMETNPSLRVQLVAKAWARSVVQGNQSVVSGLYNSRIRLNEITTELGFFADIGGRMALFQGQINKALVWFNVANEAARTGDRKAIKALVNLWPLMMVSGGLEDQSFAPRILELWQDQINYDGMNVDQINTQNIKVEGLYAALEALDYPVGEEGWLTLALQSNRSGGRVPPIGVWRQMIKSAKMNRTGEVLNITLNIFAEQSPQLLDASVLSAIVHSIKEVNLEDQARQIATEYLISLGL